MASKIFTKFPVSHHANFFLATCKTTFPPFSRRIRYSVNRLQEVSRYLHSANCSKIFKDYPPQNIGLVCCRNLHLSPVLSKKKSKDPRGNISYRIVPRERPEILSTFLISNYHKQEPISVALDMPISEVDGWFKRYLKKSLYCSICDVSVQALDEESGRTAGVLASVIYNPQESRPLESDFTNPEAHPVNRKMQEFFDGLMTGLDPVKASGITVEGNSVPKVLEHLFISVHPDFHKRGISNEMIRVSESIASNVYDCRIGMAVATSEFSYLVFRKNGYKIVKEIKYADYIDSKGQKIFADKLEKMKPHTTCRVVVKEIKCLYTGGYAQTDVWDMD